MTGAEVLDIAREGIWTLLKVAGPLMMAGLGIGVAIALVQALTQIQEMTLVFVPKIFVIFLTMLVLLPIMAQSLEAYMMMIMEHVASG